VGTSANALHIQIWTALIAMLLKYLQLRALRLVLVESGRLAAPTALSTATCKSLAG
jgi:hypothetical protein